ncbi:MAG: ATP-binding protein [Verrucomicrobiae bacterium]|nr:ATP-binding protein [Verrucomicrobiae bacterium]
MFSRWSESKWGKDFSKPYVQIVFGARQTGKSTLIRSLLPDAATVVDLSNPRERGLYLNDPGRLITLCRSLPVKGPSTWVFVDEAQSVPAVFDSVQHLYDRDKGRWHFLLCGSSARKLRQTGANLLPGRSFLHRLFPLTLAERPAPVPPIEFDAPAVLPLPWPDGKIPDRPFPAADIIERLAFGELPGVVTVAKSQRAPVLEAYTQLHLEEEMRREALVKDWPAFVRFLRLAAIESGHLVNYHKIAGDVGLSVPTIKSHYQLLDDMFLGFRLPAYSGSPRKNLLSTDRFFFFDLGVRHAAAGLNAGPDTVRANPGPLFEQWVGIELWKRLQYLRTGTLYYLRTKDGAEVDFIVEREGRLAPIEVKWTDRPTLSDARHLLTFLREHPKNAPHAYIICRCEHPLRLHDKVTALPWFCL